MILFLPDFECIVYCACMVGHGECVGLSQKEMEKRPNFLEMYLKRQLLSCPRGEFPSIQDVSNRRSVLFLIEK